MKVGDFGYKYKGAPIKEFKIAAEKYDDRLQKYVVKPRTATVLDFSKETGKGNFLDGQTHDVQGNDHVVLYQLLAGWYEVADFIPTVGGLWCKKKKDIA